MVTYVIELLDGEDNVVESQRFDDLVKADAALAEMGARIFCNDDARFDGPGVFQLGTLRWPGPRP